MLSAERQSLDSCVMAVARQATVIQHAKRHTGKKVATSRSASCCKREGGAR